MYNIIYPQLVLTLHIPSENDVLLFPCKMLTVISVIEDPEQTKMKYTVLIFICQRAIIYLCSPKVFHRTEAIYFHCSKAYMKRLPGLGTELNPLKQLV